MNSNTRLTSPESTPVTVQSLEKELGAIYAALAIVLEDCFKPGSGAAMLGVDPKKVMPWSFFESVGVRSTKLGSQLPAWYAYAYEGRMLMGVSLAKMEFVDGPFERLKDLLSLLNADNVYFHDCFETSGTDDALSHGHLMELVERAEARMTLDRRGPLSLAQLALLAKMSERSVRNAVTADGTSKLELDHNGMVSNSEALRWLEGRRGFVATVVESQRSTELPESLSAFEIPHFLEAQLYKKWRDVPDVKPTWLEHAAQAASMSLARLDEVCQQPLSVRPHEAAGLAKALDIDVVWFNKQVLWALFPEQMDMVMNPGSWKAVESDEIEHVVDKFNVVLTQAMLSNGYLAMPASIVSMFPKDCLTGRGPEQDADGKVELRFGKRVENTNIRYQSSRTLSPRTRLGVWFNKELGAKVGDIVAIEKVGERSYELTHVPKQAAS